MGFFINNSFENFFVNNKSNLIYIFQIGGNLGLFIKLKNLIFYCFAPVLHSSSLEMRKFLFEGAFFLWLYFQKNYSMNISYISREKKRKKV